MWNPNNMCMAIEIEFHHDEFRVDLSSLVLLLLVVNWSTLNFVTFDSHAIKHSLCRLWAMSSTWFHTTRLSHFSVSEAGPANEARFAWCWGKGTNKLIRPTKHLLVGLTIVWRSKIPGIIRRPLWVHQVLLQTDQHYFVHDYSWVNMA